MLSANELRAGVTFEMEGELYRVVEYAHSYIARRSATIRTKLKNLRTGAVIERRFSPTERFEEIRLELRSVQYLYSEGDLHYFMDTESYEQPTLSSQALGEAINYLKDGFILQISMHEGSPVEVVLPITVELEVVEAEPSFRGDTATAGTKSVTLETGLAVKVPLFIQAGDTIRVDTRTGEYVTRV